MNVVDIVNFLGNFNVDKIVGNQFLDVVSVASIDRAESNELSFVYSTGTKALKMINDSSAGIIICHSDTLEDLPLINKLQKALIFTKNPRLHFIKVINEFFPPIGKVKRTYLWNNPKINDTAIIAKGAKIGKDTKIGPHVVIGPTVSIGKNCIIKAGVVIGGSGFGYEKDDDGSWIKFPHLGGVIIGDNVEVGANTCIDRGTLGNTIIEDGVKIDNLCHIAHNTRIGKNSLIIALAMIGGSTKIGENCWVAPSIALRDNITIGDNAFIGLGAVVVKDVPDGIVVVGNPAKPFSKTKGDGN